LDKEVAGRLLDQVRLEMLPDGTAIGMGLGTAVARLKRSKTVEKIVVLVTDGDNNAGQLDPMTAAELAASEGIAVHTVLVGSSGPVDVPVIRVDPLSGRRFRGIQTVDFEVNPELLASIARRTGGQSFRARDTAALTRVFEEIDSLQRTAFEATRLVRTKERFEPAAMAAALLLLIGLFGEGLLGRSMW
jgi:Ca-activated chloride channel family protein